MCRSIRPLFDFELPVTDDEIRAASLQFVRKISGFHKPSKSNEAPFNQAIADISSAAPRLLHSLETAAPPKNREEEAAKATRPRRRTHPRVAVLEQSRHGVPGKKCEHRFPARYAYLSLILGIR